MGNKQKYNPEIDSKLHKYVMILQKWNKNINLIGKSTENDIWTRHIYNAKSLMKHLQTQDCIIDLGSGAGVPGLILSIMGCSYVSMIESNHKKSAFLLFAINNLNLNATVIPKRIEDTQNECDVVTCRAFGSIDLILNLCYNNILIHKKILLIKGSNVQKDIESAQTKWLFNYVIHKNDDGCIVEIEKNFKIR